MINGWLVNIVVVLVLGVYSILLQSFKVINSNNKYNSEISPIYIVDTIRIQNSCLIKFVEDDHVNNIILDRKDSAAHADAQ